MNEPPKAKVFIEGRYRKLTRDLPQTVFFCPECKGHPRRRRNCERCEGFGKLTKDSVQELVGWVAGKAFGTRRHKFHGAGREDVDVRMLGRGRPFVLELLGPKVFDVDLAEIEAEVNRRNEGRLVIEGLHWTEKARIRVLKETPHAKEYAACIRVGAELTDEVIAGVLDRQIEIVQRTPTRVAHRRADMDRTRWVRFLSIERLEEDAEDGLPRYRTVLRTQHGTYVKEVLSGEGGRTEPSLGGLLGTECECLELDVLDLLGEEGEPLPEPAARPTFGAGL